MCIQTKFMIFTDIKKQPGKQKGFRLIPASNELGSRACADIWRMPRGSNTPLIGRKEQTRVMPAACCGYLTSQSMSKGDRRCRKINLYLCATPIGNLEDISMRVLRTLQEADLIAAEDTRNSIKLLNHFEIKTPMTSYHEYNKIEKSIHTD